MEGSSDSELQTAKTSSEWTRELPETYKPTMDISIDRLAFFHILEKLKTQKRTGWIKSKIPGPESISDHMHRMSILALCTSDLSLDVPRCVMMAVVHDLAEAMVGDIAPWEGISKAEKMKREREGMRNMLSDMLHDSPAALRIGELWEEYEAQATPEAKFVKDLDRLEMALQASEYERHHSNGSNVLQPFFSSSLPNINHPEVSQWGKDLEKERAKYWNEARGSN